MPPARTGDSVNKFLCFFLVGCSLGGESEPFIGKGGVPDQLHLADCIAFETNVIDFGEHVVGEDIEPQILQVSDTCGIWETLNATLDDPDEAFQVNAHSDLEVAFSLETNIPGEWEAQWTLEPSGERDDIVGSVTIQLFGAVVPPTED